MKKLKPLKDRISTSVLKKLKTRKMTNAEAAEKYGVSPNYICRIVGEIQTKNPGSTPTTRKAASIAAAERKTFRTQLAKRCAAGKMTWAEAAEQAGCSVRTIYRYYLDNK
jgi:transposase